MLPYLERSSGPLNTSPQQYHYKSTGLAYADIAEAPNAFSFIRSEQNFLYANNALQFCGIIHRVNNTILGTLYYNGFLGYNFSTDGGFTWNDWSLDTLNPEYLRKARYPQFTAYVPSSTISMVDCHWVWTAPTIDSADAWDGHVNGVCPIQTSGTSLGSTEQYDFQGQDSYLPNALCPGLPGEYWMTEMQLKDDSLTGEFYLLKGTWDSVTSNVSWIRADTFSPAYSLSYDGQPHFSEATIEFSPDGNTGWISLLGDVAGGPDSLFSPLLWRSVDGGASWAGPTEVDLSAVTWISDSLQSLWVDSSGLPAGSGIPSTGFDHDITVDLNGNVHMGVVLLNASPRGQRPNYTVQDALAKMMVDVYTTDGGITWDVKYLYPVLAFRGEFGGASGSDPLTMDNHPKCARDEAGDLIFFQWVDSDTNTMGFGEYSNLAPNLLITSWRISDGYMACVKHVTAGDLLWGDQTCFPNLAPVTLRRGGGEHMFNGFLYFVIPGDELQPTMFLTLINDSYFGDADYFIPTLYERSWQSLCVPICMGTGEGNTLENAVLSPNPADEYCLISFDLHQPELIQLSVYDLAGKCMARQPASFLEQGPQLITLSLQDIPSGIYSVVLKGSSTQLTHKLIIAH